MTNVDEAAALFALTEAASGVPWYEIADVVEEIGSALAVVEGRGQTLDQRIEALAKDVAGRVTPESVATWRETIDRVLDEHPGTSLLTVLDDRYPVNLRRIYNRPPFLFVTGSLDSELDRRSIAVVGTRKPSAEGLDQARSLATQLAERGITVVSGLAAGIDTQAHTAALAAGGRTIAVMGTGIDRVYPAANKELAERISGNGALVSQFWPGSPPRKQNFPLRNVVTSGFAIGTAVIEANSTSGAKMQARLALEHGKRLFLVRSLVLHEEWAQRYAERPGAVIVDSVEDILRLIEAEAADPADQLALF